MNDDAFYDAAILAALPQALAHALQTLPGTQQSNAANVAAGMAVRVARAVVIERAKPAGSGGIGSARSLIDRNAMV